MANSIQQPTTKNQEITINKKTIQFYDTEGVKKVFDIHRYSDIGTLYYKRKTEVAAVL